jgi:hypothetical protein
VRVETTSLNSAHKPKEIDRIVKTKYYPVRAMLNIIPEPNRSACVRILDENKEFIERARGSSHNHQAWQGGYIEHLEETMNIAVVLYGSLSYLRHMPFALADALLVLFLHDLEKPWKYKTSKGDRVFIKRSLVSKIAQRAFRERTFRNYGIKLTAAQKNALRYVEGEGDDHSTHTSLMGPLAAFCHMMDTCSARMWPKHPVEGDTWKVWS